jgi:hypothetical protein
VPKGGALGKRTTLHVNQMARVPACLTELHAVLHRIKLHIFSTVWMDEERVGMRSGGTSTARSAGGKELDGGTRKKKSIFRRRLGCMKSAATLAE